MTTKASAFAAHYHTGQVRKYTGEPYIVHPLEVQHLVSTVPHTQAMLDAAVLHDTVEDTDARLSTEKAMDVVLKDEVRHAKKHYKCDAYAWWTNCNLDLNDCMNDDQRLIVEAAEADKGCILPGQAYRYQRGIFDGRMVTWRERVGMGNVCRDLGLYADRT